MGFSLINHPFWGTPIYGTPHLIVKWGIISDRNPIHQGQSGSCDASWNSVDVRLRWSLLSATSADWWLGETWRNKHGLSTCSHHWRHYAVSIVFSLLYLNSLMTWSLLRLVQWYHGFLHVQANLITRALERQFQEVKRLEALHPMFLTSSLFCVCYGMLWPLRWIYSSLMCIVPFLVT